MLNPPVILVFLDFWVLTFVSFGLVLFIVVGLLFYGGVSDSVGNSFVFMICVLFSQVPDLSLCF